MEVLLLRRRLPTWRHVQSGEGWGERPFFAGYKLVYCNTYHLHSMHAFYVLQDPPLAIRDMVLCTLLHVQPSLHAIDCFWQTHCDEMLISSIELGLAKKLHQLFLHSIFLYLSLFLPCGVSVVRCCYESSSWRLHVNVRFLGKRVNTKTQTFQSGNHERQ